MERNPCVSVPWVRIAEGSLESLRISYSFRCSLVSVSRISTMSNTHSRMKGFVLHLLIPVHHWGGPSQEPEQSGNLEEAVKQT